MEINPKVKDILLILGVTGFVAASIVVPGLPIALKSFLKKQHKKWGHFNQRRLRMELKRMQRVGIIEKVEEDGEGIFRLTEKGKGKLFKYKLEDLDIKRGAWDGKWRLIAYDIPKEKKNQAESFRGLLKKMKFVQLQKSVWLTPYPCSEQIEFLKNLYQLEDNVTYLVIGKLEGESAYRKYFGI